MDNIYPSSFLTVQETMADVNESRSGIYVRLRTGQLRAVKRGRKTLICRDSVEEYKNTFTPYRAKSHA